MTNASPLDVGLVIVGDEILSGKRADKHMPKVIELLAARGLQLAWAEYVGDAPDRITATLRRAFGSGDLVFSCGGIGATPDDHTRQCAGKALGVELELHPQAEVLIRERMQDIAREQGTTYEPDKADNILETVETQVSWLREVGFEHADCHQKWLQIAVFGGVKPG